MFVAVVIPGKRKIRFAKCVITVEEILIPRVSDLSGALMSLRRTTRLVFHRETRRIMQRNEFDTGNFGVSLAPTASGWKLIARPFISEGFITRAFMARPDLSENP